MSTAILGANDQAGHGTQLPKTHALPQLQICDGGPESQADVELVGLAPGKVRAVNRIPCDRCVRTRRPQSVTLA